MPNKNGSRSIDANVLLAYILQDSEDNDKRKRVNQFFNPANRGEFEIRIFVYALGEVFKRILEMRDFKKVDLASSQIQKHFQNVQGWMMDGIIVPVKVDSIDARFQDYYKEIDVRNMRCKSLHQKW